MQRRRDGRDGRGAATALSAARVAIAIARRAAYVPERHPGEGAAIPGARVSLERIARARRARRFRRPSAHHGEALEPHRIVDGELFARSLRLDWAVLLQRTFGFDALRCPKWDTKKRVIATITEPWAVKKIPSHLGMRTAPLPRARAREPTGQERFDVDAA